MAPWRLLPALPVLLAGCLDVPPREMPDIVCENVDPSGGGETATVRVRTDPLRTVAGRLLIRVDPVAEGPGPTRSGGEARTGGGAVTLAAGLAFDSRGLFRGCAGPSSELLLMVPERAMRKGWLRVGSDRPVRVVVESGARGGTPGGEALLGPGESGVIRWEGGATGGSSALREDG